MYVLYIYGTLTNIPNIGHRFGHQSALYWRSRENSAATCDGFALRVYLVFLQKGKHATD